MVGDLQRLNIGCGDDLLKGWANLDRDDHGQQWHVDVLAPFGVPWGDGWFDLVYANHFLQSFGWADLERVTAEIARVLKPGGRLLVLVPDVVAAFLAFDDGNEEWAGFRAITEPWSLERKFGHYLTWGGQNRTCFTLVGLAELLTRHGLQAWPFGGRAHNVEVIDEQWPTPQRLDESIMLEAVRV